MKLSPRLGTFFFVTVSAMGAFMFAASSQTAPTTVKGPFFDPYSGMNLYVLPPGTWMQCQKAAQELGGTLATISSAEENQFVVKTVLQDFSGSGGPNLSLRPLWIGLYDASGILQDDARGGPSSQHEANFVWVTGAAYKYRNWNLETGEPNNFSREYYTAINWHAAHGDSGVLGTWNDTPDNGTIGDGGNTDGPYYAIAALPAR